MSSPEPTGPEPNRPPAAEEFAHEQLTIVARKRRRTALIELRGELDMATVPQVAEALDELDPEADGVRHVVLDLRQVTFMDSAGLHELIARNERARSSRHNLAVVRGPGAVERLLTVSGVDARLVLVDDPDDLVPPTTDR